MSLLVSMLPVYILANFHCLGMCGPLVAILSHHRYFYLIGRIISFSLMASLAGATGWLLKAELHNWGFSAFLSIALGSFICLLALSQAGILPPSQRISSYSNYISRLLGSLLSKRHWSRSFLFGFCTVFLPCGQSLMVFSACASYASPSAGLINGFAFALLSSPSLLFAMHAKSWMPRNKNYGKYLLSFFIFFVGILSIFRGLADLSYISHLCFHNKDFFPFHFMLF